MNETLAFLNAPTPAKRLENLKKLLAIEAAPPLPKPEYANNHIHTCYSFSPYSPTAAIFFARAEGLLTAGIMDHDSVAGAEEFRQAGSLAGLGTTCGFEARVSFAGTAFETVKLNNPDQAGVAYMAFHSIRHERFGDCQKYLAPLRKKRADRLREVTKKAQAATGVALDFDRDVLPLSKFHEGGGVTERHVLFALAGKLPGGEDEAGCYHILGKLKSELMPEIFVPADDELMTLEEAAALSKALGAVLCYAYLGDVTASPTGDKSPARYEDAFLDDLFALLVKRGVDGVTFMPSRNTAAQLHRVMDLCNNLGLRQISGEDVNAPNQSFICPQLRDPAYRHLVDAAWDLVRREA